MQIFFTTREASRKFAFGKLVDNGPEAPKGQRYSRKLPLNGNAKQRRVAFRKLKVGAK